MKQDVIATEAIQMWKPLAVLRKQLLVEKAYRMGWVPYWHYAVALSDMWAMSWGKPVNQKSL